MKEAFLRLFPGGFYDPKVLDEERNHKLETGDLLAHTLSRTELSALLKTGITPRSAGSPSRS
jgi:hypothetical protein